jgi:hypothetical protein
MIKENNRTFTKLGVHMKDDCEPYRTLGIEIFFSDG